MNTNTAICPNEMELLLFKQNLLSEEVREGVFKHITFCEKCFIDVEFLEIDTDEEFTGNESIEPPTIINEEVKQLNIIKSNTSISLDEILKNNGLKIGQIWRPKAEDILSIDNNGNVEKLSFQQLDSIPHLVVITNTNSESLEGHKIIGVTPVHAEFDLKKEDDWLVKEENSPLGYPILLQSWNHCEMLMENLEACFGEISDKDLLKKLESLGNEKRYSNQSNYYSLEAAIKRGDFVPHYKPLYFGNLDKIHDDKTRNSEINFYRVREFKETSYLYTPVENFREVAEWQTQTQSVGEKESVSLWDKFLNLITPILYYPETAHAAPKIKKEWIEVAEFYDGLIKLSKRSSSNDDNLMILQSDDEEVANFVIKLYLGENLSILALMSNDDYFHEGYVSSLNLGENTYPSKIQITKISDFSDLDIELVRRSLSHIETENGLRAWKRLPEHQKTNPSFAKIIIEALEELNKKDIA